MTIPILHESHIEALAAAVFAPPGALVLEAYSEFDKEARQLHSPEQLAEFILLACKGKDRLAHFFVVYPDMMGQPMRETIHLDQTKVQKGRVRYTWSGWGLISVVLTVHPNSSSKPSVTSNSEVRARAWAPVHSEWPSPDVWDWKAVERHTRRLRRILKMQLLLAANDDSWMSA